VAAVQDERGGVAVAGEVTVNRAAMTTAAAQVEDALGEIRGQQGRLVGFHEQLAGTWKGEASAAFTNAFNQFDSDFNIVIRALQGIQERLVSSHANYNATETANTESMSKISAALNR
jgi:WXG100 family type VII secretion target